MTTLPAAGALHAAWLLLALPSAGAAILLLGGRRTDRWGHLLGCATTLAAFAYGAAAFAVMLGYPAAQRARDLRVFTWFPGIGAGIAVIAAASTNALRVA